MSSNPRKRMTALERREQLIAVGRELFATRGYEAVTVEEIAAAAKVSKPVVYEHFGGQGGREPGVKEAIYAVIVDREMTRLMGMIEAALSQQDADPQVLLERAAIALLSYIEDSTEGFQILVRDSPVGLTSGSFSNLITDVAVRVQHLLAKQFKAAGFDAKTSPMYSEMLVGMVAMTGQWWLDVRKPKKEEVAAHLVNLAWNGLSNLQHKPKLISAPE